MLSTRIGFFVHRLCKTPASITLRFFPVLEKAKLPEFICRFFRMIYCNSFHTSRVRRENQETLLHGQRRQKRLSGERLLFGNGVLILFTVGSKTRSSQETLLSKIFFILLRVPVIFRWVLRPSDHCWPGGLGGRTQPQSSVALGNSMAGWRQNICFVCLCVFGIHIRTRWGNPQGGGPCVEMNHCWFFQCSIY